MTSFATGIEPRPQPRLAAAILLLHLFAAAFPWMTHCPPGLAAVLSLLALAGLGATISRVPGPHCRLRRVSWRDGEWRVMVAGEPAELTAKPAPGTRVHANLVVLDLQAGQRRLGWLLPRAAVGPADFRRLKARLRMAC